MPVKYDYE
jgi:hypothetical protein